MIITVLTVRETANKQTQMPNTGFYIVYMSYVSARNYLSFVYDYNCTYCVRNSKRANSTG